MRKFEWIEEGLRLMIMNDIFRDKKYVNYI